MKLAETLKSERMPKESKVNRPQMESEIHRPFSRVTDGRNKKMEKGLSIMVADAELKTGELISDTEVREAERFKEQGKVSREEINQHHEHAGQVSKVSISTCPWTFSCDGEQANSQKEIREGLFKLVQKLIIGIQGIQAAANGGGL